MVYCRSRPEGGEDALDMAGRAAFDEQMGRAAKYLVEAFRLNPNLKNDAYAVGIASTATGLYKSDAVKAVMDGSALELFDKKELTAKVPTKKKGDDIEVEEVQVPATWGAAIVDLLLYGLINAVIVIGAALLVVNIIISTVQNDPAISRNWHRTARRWRRWSA